MKRTIWLQETKLMRFKEVCSWQPFSPKTGNATYIVKRILNLTHIGVQVDPQIAHNLPILRYGVGQTGRRSRGQTWKPIHKRIDKYYGRINGSFLKSLMSSS